MTEQPEILVTDADGVRTITIDRPQARNALSAAMQTELSRQCALADQDADVRVVVLTGTDPAFCAGNDFTDVGQFADRYANRFRTDPAKALRAMSTPVICAVNGACVSGGFEVALSASFIVASERARFADTHVLLDVLPTWGLSALLPRAVGVRTARELSLTGRFVSAEEALALRFVNHVVPHGDLLPFAGELAARIAGTSAVGDLLALYARGEDLPLSAALSAETASAFSRPLDVTAFTARGRTTAENAPRED